MMTRVSNSSGSRNARAQLRARRMRTAVRLTWALPALAPVHEQGQRSKSP